MGKIFNKIRKHKHLLMLLHAGSALIIVMLLLIFIEPDTKLNHTTGMILKLYVDIGLLSAIGLCAHSIYNAFKKEDNPT